LAATLLIPIAFGATRAIAIVARCPPTTAAETLRTGLATTFTTFFTAFEIELNNPTRTPSPAQHPYPARTYTREGLLFDPLPFDAVRVSFQVMLELVFEVDQPVLQGLVRRFELVNRLAALRTALHNVESNEASEAKPDNTDESGQRTRHAFPPGQTKCGDEPRFRSSWST